MKNFIVSVLVFFVLIGVYFGVACLLASWLCDINPSKTYSWLGGIWHGLFSIPNLIRSLFNDALFWANSYTTGYKFFWWLFTLLCPLWTMRIGYLGYNILLALFGSIVSLFSKNE